MNTTLERLRSRMEEDENFRSEVYQLQDRLGELPSTVFFRVYQPQEVWFFRRNHGDHGIDHETRVLVLSELLARAQRTTLNQEAIRWAAITHDTRRIADGYDFEHGIRAARWVRSFLEGDASVDVETVAYLNEWHVPHDHHAPRMTPELSLLKDADGLDQQRVGLFEKRFLRNPYSNQLVHIAQYLCNFSGILRREMDDFEAVMAAGRMMGIIGTLEPGKE